MEQRFRSFPISAYLSDATGVMYTEEAPSLKTETKRKEYGMDADDRKHIAEDFWMRSHQLNIDSIVLYNMANYQVAPDNVNVPDAMRIYEPMVASFKNSLTGGFHSKISSPMKTMEKLRQGIKSGDKSLFDLDTIFLRLYLVEQQRQLRLDTVFQHELCVAPSSLCDECGCLHKGNNAVLEKRPGVPLQNVLGPVSI